MKRRGDAEPIGWVERLDFWTGKPMRVFAVRVLRAETWRLHLQGYSTRYPQISWYNADLLPEQLYCYDRDIFPLMRCEVEHRDGRLVRLECRDDRWANEFDAPQFEVVRLSCEGSLAGPRPTLRSLTLQHENETLTWDEPEGMLEGFQHTFDRIDPDVVLTSGGDSLLFPLLYSMAEAARFPLRLDRDPPAEARKIKTNGRSYFSYGRILYQAPEYPLFGRWHIDRENSFTFGHDGLDGLYEVTRMSRLPPQRIARRSIGTGISSIQLDMAYREGYLIPWKKTFPESWKTARQLLKTDRGGLVYAPETGFYEDVLEVDFVSLYPSIMSRFNVSPETVNCACCNNSRVPEIGYTICEKRQGLVARALGPIIEKRVRYKALRKAAKARGDTDAYAQFDRRQDALKWMLVCCFGYLGYRNARFGRIEAHESVSAWSREILVSAREIAEAAGWHMLHANVDSLWLTKRGFRDEEVDALCAKIGATTNLTIAVEGIYRWIAFLPSRQFADRPVPTRYFGAFRDGSLKYRGIECRRRDIPVFVRDAQLEVLKMLAEARGTEEYRAMMPAVLARIDEFEQGLWRHEVPLDQLLVRQSLSKDPEEYSGNGSQAIAARQAAKAGLNLHAGESLCYLITSADDTDRSRRVRVKSLMNEDTTYDPAAYVRMLRHAMNTLLAPAEIVLDEKKILPPRAKSGKKKALSRQLLLDFRGSG